MKDNFRHTINQRVIAQSISIINKNSNQITNEPKIRLYNEER